jgi:hypothetical protein
MSSKFEEKSEIDKLSHKEKEHYPGEKLKSEKPEKDQKDIPDSKHGKESKDNKDTRKEGKEHFPDKSVKKEIGHEIPITLPDSFAMSAAAGGSPRPEKVASHEKPFLPEKPLTDTKFQKEFKIEIKEIKFEKEHFKDKHEKLEFEGYHFGPQFPVGPGPVEQRIAALEGTMAQLLHFIPKELRPDLSQGALRQEPDAPGEPAAKTGEPKIAPKKP